MNIPPSSSQKLLHIISILLVSVITILNRNYDIFGVGKIRGWGRGLKGVGGIRRGLQDTYLNR